MSKTLETSIEISGVLSPSLQAAIKNAISSLESMSKETLEAAGAGEKLAAEIKTQESVLASLERGYADFVLTGAEGTEEAQALAQQIQTLSSELDDNKGSLEAAQDAAEKLASGMNKTESEADQLRGTISQQESTLQQLKEKYVALQLSEGDTTDESKELARQIDSLSSELQDNKQKLADAERAADQFDNSLEDLDDSAKLADQGFTVFKATLANLAADVIRNAIQAVKDLASNVIELGTNFSSTMSEVAALSGATGDELERLEATAREYGATTTFSATESAEALKYMALAGWDVEQSTSALGGVLNLAAASGMELGAASDMVTDYLSAFAMEADRASYFADILAYAQAHSNTSAEQLGEAYKNCAANLNAAGQDVETVTSMLEGMANQGYKGSEAGTALSAMMRDITKNMKNGAIQIGDTTIAVQDAQGNYRDLTDILGEVENAVDGMGSAERAAALSSTFTADSTKGLNLLLNEGIDNIAGYEDALRGSAGAAEEMAGIMNDNLKGDMAQMNSAWEELGLKIYDKVEPALRAATQFVTSSAIPAIEWCMNHLPELGIILSAIGAAIAAFKWGSILKKITMLKGALKGIAAALGGVSAPALAVIAVIAAVALAFTNLWRNNEEFRNKITAIWDSIKSKFEAFGQTITNKLNELGFDFENFTEVLSTVWNGFCELLAPVFEGVFQQIANILGVVLDVLVGLFDVFAGIFTGDWDRVWEGIKEIFSGVWDFLIATFQNWGDTFVALADTVLGWFGTDWETVWGAIRDFFVGIWEGISSWFSSTLTAIESFFVGIWTGISDFFTGLWTGLTSFVSSTLSGIASTFSNIWSGITSFLSGAWETIKNIVQVGLMAVGEIISAAVQIITLPFRFIWENCKDTLIPIWETIKSTVSDALSAIGNWISEKMEAAKQAFTTITTAISTTASTVWNAISSITSTIWGNIQNAVGSKIEAARATFSTVSGAIKSAASTAWSAISSTTSSIWGTITSTISSKVNSAKSTVSSVFNSIKSTISSVLNSALSTVNSIFGSIQSAISNKINAAKSAVSSAISAIKSAFNFSWSLPKLKLPHISISGSFSINPPSVPHFGISWYKEGGILTQPTIFGAAGNNLLAGGEAGAEAVVPLATLWDKLETMIRSVFNSASSTGGGAGEALTQKAGQLLTLDNFSLGSLANEGGTVIYYDFSGFTWSPQIQTGGPANDEDDLMAKLRAHEAEFFDWLEEFIEMREVAQYA